jgi:hypothetical protein
MIYHRGTKQRSAEQYVRIFRADEDAGGIADDDATASVAAHGVSRRFARKSSRMALHRHSVTSSAQAAAAAARKHVQGCCSPYRWVDMRLSSTTRSTAPLEQQESAIAKQHIQACQER